MEVTQWGTIPLSFQSIYGQYNNTPTHDGFTSFSSGVGREEVCSHYFEFLKFLQFPNIMGVIIDDLDFLLPAERLRV